MIKLQDGYYIDTDRGIKAPRLSYILDQVFPKPPYADGAAEAGTIIHEHCATFLRPGRTKEYDWDNSGGARPYVENYERFLDDYGLSRSQGRMAEAAFLGEMFGGGYGFPKNFHYGCRVDAYFPKAKTLVEIKTGGTGPQSSIMDINRDWLQIICQNRAIGREKNLRLILVYLKGKRYKAVTLPGDGLHGYEKLIVPALICWYSKYGGKLK